MGFQSRKLYTNAFVIQDGKLLLGYKKRGFGQHIYNGFGGKVEPGETPLEAAARELQEEAGIQASLKHVGMLFFVSEGIDQAFQIEIYRADGYSGIITETEEMLPSWFRIPKDHSVTGDDGDDVPPIPFDKMWGSDRFWIPLLLANRPFVGRTDFGQKEEGKFKLLRWWFGVADLEPTNTGILAKSL